MSNASRFEFFKSHHVPTLIWAKPDHAPRLLNFRDGLVMQLLNPKAIVVTLPIASLQFPAAGIQGVSLVVVFKLR